MRTDTQELLNFLKAELKTLESGHYTVCERQPWRARLVFEDCEYCPNYGRSERTVPCQECPLIGLVPHDHRQEKVPCRFIPLNANGDTLDSLYRSGTQEELEAAVGEWLRRTIRHIEAESGLRKTATLSGD